MTEVQLEEIYLAYLRTKNPKITTDVGSPQNKRMLAALAKILRDGGYDL